MADTTKVRFDLWAVLGAICVLGGLLFGYMFDLQGADRKEATKVKDRVIVLEQQYQAINQKLDKLVCTTEKISDAFIDHRVKTEKTKITLRGKE